MKIFGKHDDEEEAADVNGQSLPPSHPRRRHRDESDRLELDGEPISSLQSAAAQGGTKSCISRYMTRMLNDYNPLLQNFCIAQQRLFSPRFRVPDMDSSDDDICAGWPFMRDEFVDDDTTLSDWLRLNSDSGLPVSASTSWAPLPFAHFTGSAYPDEFYAGFPDVPSAGDLSDGELDNPLGGLPVNLARVAATPFVPSYRAATNQRMRVSFRRHRQFVRAGLRPGNVSLPLPMDSSHC